MHIYTFCLVYHKQLVLEKYKLFVNKTSKITASRDVGEDEAIFRNVGCVFEQQKYLACKKPSGLRV
jgi:hypothetical protein